MTMLILIYVGQPLCEGQPADESPMTVNPRR